MIFLWTFLSFALGINFLTFFLIAITSIPLGLILGAAVAFFLIYIYPDWKIYKRKKSLDANAALATIYMELLYTAGMPPQYIFKILSKFPEFKEVHVEAKFINRLVNLGVDLPTALERAVKTCPDSLWKQLIDGMRQMIISGGDLRIYLKQKRDEMIDAYRARYKAYTDFLGILTEVYINLVIVGAIFLTIIVFVAAMLNAIPGTLAALLLKFLIYFVLPFFSFIITILIKESNPFSD
ncbi:MAG: type II secretion system F family protein [Nanoarchaeota archaeon]